MVLGSSGGAQEVQTVGVMSANLEVARGAIGEARSTPGGAVGTSILGPSRGATGSAAGVDEAVTPVMRKVRAVRHPATEQALTSLTE